MRSGEVVVPFFEPFGDFGEEICGPAEPFQPNPDSRRMEDLTGSGELDKRRFRRGDFLEAISPESYSTNCCVDKRRMNKVKVQLSTSTNSHSWE